MSGVYTNDSFGGSKNYFQVCFDFLINIYTISKYSFISLWTLCLLIF